MAKKTAKEFKFDMDAIESMFDTMRVNRAAAIAQAMKDKLAEMTDEERAEVDMPGLERDCMIEWDFERAPKTTGIELLKAVGVDGMSAPLETIIKGLELWGVRFRGRQYTTDAKLLKLLREEILLDVVPMIPPSNDHSEIIDLTPPYAMNSEPSPFDLGGCITVLLPKERRQADPSNN